MRSKNHVTFRGHVGKDPEFRSLGENRELAVFHLGMTEKWKDRETGDPREHTEWARIVVYQEHLVNIVKRYVKKGSGIEIEGKFTTRKFDENGVDKYITEIVLDGPKADLALLTEPKNGIENQPRDQQQSGPGGNGQGQRNDRGQGNGQSQRMDRGGGTGGGRGNGGGGQSSGQSRNSGRGQQASGDGEWASVPF
jgi:single-strand DNA-binding protein